LANSDFALLEADAVQVAPRLLGCLLEREVDGEILRVKIVETEAYDQTDEASHSYAGKRQRAATMFGPAGHLYVYFTYGMHYCCNITTSVTGFGSGVLIRAVEPVDGKVTMARNRHGRDGIQLTNGPAKVCQALQIDRQFDGHDLRENPIRLVLQPTLDPSLIIQTTRVGIARAIDKPWRFYVRGNAYVSKP